MNYTVIYRISIAMKFVQKSVKLTMFWNSFCVLPWQYSFSNPRSQTFLIMLWSLCFVFITIKVQSQVVVVYIQILNRSILISMLCVKKTTVSSSPASLNTESHAFINYLQNRRIISIPHKRFLEMMLRHSCECPIRLMMQTTVLRLKRWWRTKYTKTDFLYFSIKNF